MEPHSQEPAESSQPPLDFVAEGTPSDPEPEPVIYTESQQPAPTSPAEILDSIPYERRRRKLTLKQRLFVNEYLVDFNARQASLRAGYHGTVAVLSRPWVAEAIESAKAQLVARVQVTQETVLNEMAILANSSIEHYIIDDFGNVQPADGAPHGCMRAIQSIRKRTTVKVTRDGTVSKTYDVELRLWDKPTPLRLLGRQVGLFSERMEHTGPNGGPIEMVSRIERIVVDPVPQTQELDVR